MPRAPIAAGRSFEARAVRETGPDPAGCSPFGHGEAGPPAHVPQPSRPALPGSHAGIGPARRGLPRTGCRRSAEGPQRRRGTSEPRRCLTEGRAGPAAVQRGAGARGGPGTRAGLTHAAAATRRSFARCRLLPTAPPRPIPALGGSRGRGQWDGGSRGDALLLVGSAGGPPREAAGRQQGWRVVRLPLRSDPCRPAAAGLPWDLLERGESCVAAGPCWASRVGRSVCWITARVNLVLCVWGYCEIIASRG